jgi:hypothetical protein
VFRLFRREQCPRRRMTKGAVAMAVALIYPKSENVGDRGKRVPRRKTFRCFVCNPSFILSFCAPHTVNPPSDSTPNVQPEQKQRVNRPTLPEAPNLEKVERWQQDDEPIFAGSAHARCSAGFRA